ncbi:hypothetical protein VNI00_012994 [Paramarasmius palmivorus]|uniref:Heme haloperoxidase family profile domain-containing protein n=1 Tax=Paramarasmius palmivorus TaxID=297713 RepID=A0AAW0BZQ5_9AGAR
MPSPRSGKSISLSALIHAIAHVYNFSYFHASVLSLPAILRYAKWTWRFWDLKIDLASLSQFGVLRIAHVSSLGHSDEPSHSPDPHLVEELLDRARTNPSGGLDLRDLAAVRFEREEKLGRKLDFLHEQLAFGECGFFYLSMRDPKSGVIPEERIKQWFGEERLPNGWWEAVRPSRTVGFFETRKTAYVVEQLVKTFSVSERDVVRNHFGITNNC